MMPLNAGAGGTCTVPASVVSAAAGGIVSADTNADNIVACNPAASSCNNN